MPGDNTNTIPEQMPESIDVVRSVAEKIAEAHNILVALSADPSVDEMAAAIGLSIYLDKIGKKATAIYSGATPNALEFLNPEETFEDSADILRDFVIALNKDKADHLRYKLDGDFVKIYITPYKTKVLEEDLEFSYGDYNVDLVLALDVANGVDLDAALREHGRIMHDAVIVNITTSNPGKLGEIEWSDKSSSSVSEMIAKLIYSIGGETKLGKEEATAFLTGIVAATNRFSSASTTSVTMEMASKLMDSGANQQLIAKNITPDVDNELFSLSGVTERKNTDPTNLEIEHGEDVEDGQEVEGAITEKESTLLDDLKAAEAELAMTSAEIVPEAEKQALTIADGEEVRNEGGVQDDISAVPEIGQVIVQPTADFAEPIEVAQPVEGIARLVGPISASTMSTSGTGQPEMVIQPPADFTAESLTEGTNKYGQMLEDALNEETTNLAAAAAPAATSTPEINGVPEMNYMPMPDEGVLPPPPTPPIDMDADINAVPQVEPAPAVAPIAPAQPVLEPAPEPLGAQPAMQDQVYN